MDVSSLKVPFALLRGLAAVGGSALATAAARSEAPKDSVSLSAKPTRTVIDADCNVIERHGDPDRLGRLVDHFKLGSGADDCRVIHKNPTPHGEHGYVVMAGKDMPSDHLTVPLAPITGTESPELTQPGAENYFADAWKDGRQKTAEFLGTTADQLPRNAIALAVNSQGGRSQDRLHIHADRLDPKLGGQLKEQLEHGQVVREHWTNLEPVNGHHYRALWVDGADLTQNPFQLVHDQLAAEHGGGQAGERYALTHMGQHSLAVVGETDSQGKPGFIIIDGRYGNDPYLPNGPHNSGSAEEWLLGHANTPP